MRYIEAVDALDSSKEWNAVQRWLEGSEHVLILSGAAGTGKTTLVRAVVQWARARGQTVSLLAPTGRAARILSERTDAESRTIHSVIFGAGSVEVLGLDEDETPNITYRFPLRGDGPSSPLIVVDEASMVGNRKSGQGIFQFGSGKLLADLLTYGRPSQPGGARFIFVGDRAQLPPVGESASAALDRNAFAALGLETSELELSKNYRQGSESTILEVAADLREQIISGRPVRMDFSVGVDVEPVKPEDAIEHVLQDIQQTIVVSRTNGGVLEHNRAIRSARWGESNLGPQAGDRLLITQNSRRYGLLNGDIVDLLTVGEAEEVDVPLKGRIGMTLCFRRVEILHDGRRESCLILENQLDTDKSDVDLIRARMIEFERRVRLPRRSSEYLECFLHDERLNALAVQYGYAVTAHKAQGGEWERVIVDFSHVRRSPEDFRWVYTAITRARSRLWTLGAPKFSPYEGLAPNSNGEAEPFAEQTLLRQSGIEILSERRIQDGRQFVIASEGIECTLNRYQGRRGTKWVYVKGCRQLFHQLEGLVAPNKPNGSEAIEDFLRQLRRGASPDGELDIERIQPYRVTVRMTCAFGSCSVEFTHDKNYRWKGPTDAPSWVRDWLSRVSKL